MLQCTSQTDGLRLLSDRMSQDIRRSIYAASNLSLLQRTHLTVWCSQWHNIFFTPTSLSCKLLSNASTSCTFLHWLSYLQWIASAGFTVVSIDHPYDADIVEFPDGTVIKGNVTTEEEIVAKLAIRVQDVSFVLSQLSRRSITNQLLLSRPYPSSTKATIFGHSFGGATAANAMLADKRFIGGLNMDGSIFPPAVNISSHGPFLILAAHGHNQSTDATWATSGIN